MAQLSITVMFRNGVAGTLVVDNPQWIPLDVTHIISGEDLPTHLWGVRFGTDKGCAEVHGKLALSRVTWRRED